MFAWCYVEGYTIRRLFVTQSLARSESWLNDERKLLD